MYNPGVTNCDDVQSEMVAQLEASGMRYAILDRLVATTCEPENASCDPGSTILDSYLASTFTMEAQFGYIVVVKRQ